MTTVTTDRINSAGTMASLLCAIHCALMPLFITLLPMIGLGFLASEPTEWALIGLSAVLGLMALFLGYREHKKRRALLILAMGLVMLIVGRVAEEHEWGKWSVLVLVAGGLMMALSHFINGLLCRKCRTCHKPTLSA